jgi:hypothetical protein
MVQPVFERLGELGVIMEGHGGKSTQQLRVVLKIGKITERKPRFLVIDPGRLAP